jgi:mono/diheme cytochrome c family protein
MSAADYLRESLRKPTAFVSPAFVDSGGPTSGMPDLGLSDAEIEAVVRYLLAAD